MTSTAKELHATQETSPTKMSKDGKKTLLTAFMGFTIDMIDVYLPIIALAPAMIYFQPSHLSPTLATTIYFTIFILSLLGRPIGSFIFGYAGDKIGRRKTTLIAIAGIGATTLLIAILPGYSTWGLTGIVLMAILRFLSGVFMGGEYTSANPLAMEMSPKKKRGLFGGIINAGFPFATIIVSVVTLITLHFLPAGDATALYSLWGWRIPFLLGVLISVSLFIYSYYELPESEVWANSKVTENPLKALFSKKHSKSLFQVFVLMTGVWFITNAIISSLPGMLKFLQVDSTLSTYSQFASNIFLFAFFILAGAFSQKVGRRKVLTLFGVSSFTIAPIIYFFLLRGGYENVYSLIGLAILLHVLSVPIFGVLTSYITERFDTSVRASGYGVGYSLALVIPSLTPYIMLGLKSFMPYVYTPIVILVVGGICITIGALMGPETKDVDFKLH
ncbi:MFS transporter [Rummeliibacillus sp. JY-2-4R]